MIVKSDTSTMTLFLESRIDSGNAADIESELFSAVNSKGSTISSIVIDASALEYISSAGLHVLMKLRKSLNGILPVINVPVDIYELFDNIGFTEILDVKKAS